MSKGSSFLLRLILRIVSPSSLVWLVIGGSKLPARLRKDWLGLSRRVFVLFPDVAVRLALLSGVWLSKVKGVVELMTELAAIMGEAEPEEGVDPGVLMAVPRAVVLTGTGSNLPGLL